MSPEPSFTQYLREEGFIQGPDGEDKAATPTKTEKTNIEKEVAEPQKETVKEETVKPQKEIVKEEVKTPSNNTNNGISPLLIALIVVVILVIIVLIVLKPF